MNRLVIAVVVLAAVGAGTYFFVARRPEPGPADPRSGQVTTDQTAAGGDPKVELVDPKSAPNARANLERPDEAPRVAKDAGTKPAPGPLQPKSAPSDPGMPANLPSIDDVDETPFVDKYANATPDERRLALESLTLTYKDAAAGRIKNSEQLIRELEVEMHWLENHIDR